MLPKIRSKPEQQVHVEDQVPQTAVGKHVGKEGPRNGNGFAEQSWESDPFLDQALVSLEKDTADQVDNQKYAGIDQNDLAEEVIAFEKSL